MSYHSNSWSKRRMRTIMADYPTPEPPPAKAETLAKLVAERARFSSAVVRPLPTTQRAVLAELTQLRAIGNVESVGGREVRKWLEAES